MEIVHTAETDTAIGLCRVASTEKGLAYVELPHASGRGLGGWLRRCARGADLVEAFARHLHNVAKKLEEDQQTGSKRYVYIRLGEDHFRHAFNYCAISMHELSRGFFSGVDLL